jgi:hypothetical protein
VAPRRGLRSQPAAAHGDAQPLAWSGLFAARPSGPAPRAPELAGDEPAFDFRAGRVDAASLPRAELRRAFAAAIDALPQLANRLDPQGWPPLREEIARGLVARGVACRADDVLIVQGAQEVSVCWRASCSTRRRRGGRGATGSARASPARGRPGAGAGDGAACAPMRWPALLLARELVYVTLAVEGRRASRSPSERRLDSGPGGGAPVPAVEDDHEAAAAPVRSRRRWRRRRRRAVLYVAFFGAVSGGQRRLVAAPVQRRAAGARRGALRR